MNATAPRAVSVLPERYERALVQSTRALAGDERVQIRFSPQGPRLDGRTFLLPIPAKTLDEAEWQKLRGHADRLALRYAHHQAALHSRYRPAGLRAREVYDALEDVRCQSIGAQVLAGVEKNLEAAWLDTLERNGVLKGQFLRTTGVTQAVALLAREKMTGRPPPPEAASLMAKTREFIGPRTLAALSKLGDAGADQERYAFAAHDLVKTLDLGYEIGEDVEEKRKTREAQMQAVPGAGGEAPMAEALRVKEGQGVLENDDPIVAAKQPLESLDTGEDEPVGKPTKDDASERMLHQELVDDSDHPNRNYRVFTRAHDEIVEARTLAAEEELGELRLKLDRESRGLQSVVAKLANRLERMLLTQQQRHWKFDLDEGLLDPARLSRIITDPLSSLSFKEEQESDFKDTVVTVLLDNSGSMRGRPILLTALCADVLARTLERCGVKVEILGFTTSAWKGGKSREDWLKAGARSNPGRLGDLRYIIYKDADAPWRRSRRDLALMLQEDLLKENIDGEALLWAHERLLARREQRRILMVISDGVPLDEATLSANAGSFLEQHLRNVVKWIETRSAVELLAIGIGHDVTDYYQRAVAIGGPEELGAAMIEQLASLFLPRQRHWHAKAS